MSTWGESGRFVYKIKGIPLHPYTLGSLTPLGNIGEDIHPVDHCYAQTWTLEPAVARDVRPRGISISVTPLDAIIHRNRIGQALRIPFDRDLAYDLVYLVYSQDSNSPPC
jgi:hypothetical protein